MSGEDSPSSETKTLQEYLEKLGSISLANNLSELSHTQERKILVEKHSIYFSTSQKTTPTQLLGLKKTLQELLDLKNSEQELKSITELVNDKTTNLLNMLSDQDIDEAHISSIFDFLGKNTTFAIRREGKVLYNQGLDSHTLAIATRRAENIESHSYAIARGELFSCRCGHYQGYFLRNNKFEHIETTLIKLYLNFLSRNLEQQQLHKVILKLNELFSNAFNLSDTPESFDPKNNIHTFEENFGHLLECALKDSLTQAYNRNKTSELLALMCKRQDNFTAILIDIDYFKRINDTHGHLVGDRVLVELVERLSSHIRQHDILARWGGEEFLILIPLDKHIDIFSIAERMRKSIEERPMATDVDVTISLGVTIYQQGDTPKGLLQRADTALYRAKHEGRNKVIIDL